MRTRVIVGVICVILALLGSGAATIVASRGRPSKLPVVVAPPPTASPTRESVGPTQSVAGEPTSSSLAPAIAAPHPSAPGPRACGTLPPRTPPDPDRPRYSVRIAIDAAARTATGSTTIDFTPDIATDRVVVRLWPAAPKATAAGGAMDPGPMTVDGVGVAVERPDPTTLVVRRALDAHRTVRISLAAWKITIPGATTERWATAGGAVRLGSFAPLLPWEPGRGWATEAPTLVHGEASTSPTASWDLHASAVGGADRHRLDVLSGGVIDPADPTHATFDAVRDIAVAAGTFRFARRSAVVAGRGAPVPVVVGVDAGVSERPDAYADKAVRSLQQMSARFGPYAFGGYTLAITAGLPGGIEYPGFVFAGPNAIGRSTSHEIGHQWFYALVGNDQARDPWLDEGLATWAEAGYEGTLASFVARSIPSEARGHAGAPTSYYDTRSGSYYSGVYVQGTQALAALGPPVEVDCALAAYVAINANRIATNASLIDAMAARLPGAEATLARYGIHR